MLCSLTNKVFTNVGRYPFLANAHILRCCCDTAALKRTNRTVSTYVHTCSLFPSNSSIQSKRYSRKVGIKGPRAVPLALHAAIDIFSSSSSHRRDSNRRCLLRCVRKASTVPASRLPILPQQCYGCSDYQRAIIRCTNLVHSLHQPRRHGPSWWSELWNNVRDERF